MSNKALTRLVIVQFIALITMFIYFNYKTAPVSSNQISFDNGLNKITFSEDGLVVKEDSLTVMRLNGFGLDFYNDFNISVNKSTLTSLGIQTEEIGKTILDEKYRIFTIVTEKGVRNVVYIDSLNKKSTSDLDSNEMHIYNEINKLNIFSDSEKRFVTGKEDVYPINRDYLEIK